MLEPSVETKTSVLWWAVPEKLSAISRSAAVAATLVVAPLPRATSRGAISGDLAARTRPGRVAIRFRISTSCRSNEPSKLCSETVAPGIAANWLFDLLGELLVRLQSPGSDREPTCRAPSRAGAALAGSKASGGIPGGQAPWTSCSENIAIAATTGTASSAYLQRRRSIISRARIAF